jgi:hypothetical protein
MHAHDAVSRWVAGQLRSAEGIETRDKMKNCYARVDEVEEGWKSFGRFGGTIGRHSPPFVSDGTQTKLI